jgi:hypothetical protein
MRKSTMLVAVLGLTVASLVTVTSIAPAQSKTRVRRGRGGAELGRWGPQQ